MVVLSLTHKGALDVTSPSKSTISTQNWVQSLYRTRLSGSFWYWSTSFTRTTIGDSQLIVWNLWKDRLLRNVVLNFWQRSILVFFRITMTIAKSFGSLVAYLPSNIPGELKMRISYVLVLIASCRVHGNILRLPACPRPGPRYVNRFGLAAASISDRMSGSRTPHWGRKF